MKGSGSAIASSATSSAAPCCCILWTPRASTPGRPTRRCDTRLEAYGAGLVDKPEIVALSKVDAVDAETLKTQMARLKRAAKRTPLKLSAVSGRGHEGSA